MPLLSARASRLVLLPEIGHVVLKLTVDCRHWMESLEIIPLCVKVIVTGSSVLAMSFQVMLNALFVIVSPQRGVRICSERIGVAARSASSSNIV